MYRPGSFPSNCYRDLYKDVCGSSACWGRAGGSIRAHAGDWRGETWRVQPREYYTAMQSDRLLHREQQDG